MLNTPSFYISALVRWSNENLHSAYVVNKGDPERGLILISQPMLSSSLVRIWVQQTGDDGLPSWRQRFDEDQDSDAAASFIERELQRDEDLWVIEIEGTQGDLPSVLTAANLI